MNVVYTPFDCCGMIAAHSFSGQKEELRTLIEHQLWERATCAMIVLTDNQPESIAQAEREGFKKIQTFVNSKTYTACHIMTRIQSA